MTSIVDAGRVEVLGERRVAEGLDPDADLGRRRVADPSALPKISNTQSSPHRSCSGSSSNPLIQSAAIDRGDSVIRARIATRPPVGSQPSKRSCSSRTTCPSRNRCWPWALPTGPDQLPDWMPETRSGGWWSSAHQTGWSTGTSSTRVSRSIRWLAAVAAREDHPGR